MSDRIRVQVIFRKGIFTCECGQEDIVDWSTEGGNTYENNCSVCGKWNNSFKDYNGCLLYKKDEYERMDRETIEINKSSEVDKFLYDQKNLPPYVEPTIEELEIEKLKLDRQVTEIQSRIDARRRE
jgi:hypothetical protein